MEWEGEELAKLLKWLEDAREGPYASERRLDPLATSMRNFDDVSEDLRQIRDGNPPKRKDPGQRVSDLRGAALVEVNQIALSSLGERTFSGWEHYGVANSDIDDELARHLILLTEANRLEVPLYRSLVEYWDKLTERFAGFDLIDNWSALYVLNYLDYPRNGYCPGDRYNQDTVSVEELRFDLVEIAQRRDGDEQSIEGAKRLKKAINGKIPRGRHRATFCSALEIISGGQGSMDVIFERFGIPKAPGTWSKLAEDRKATIGQIAGDYGCLELEDKEPDVCDSVVDDDEALVLPENMDFANALVGIPPRRVHRTRSGGETSTSKESTVNHVKRASVTKRIGDLGEEFAIRYERWRLREYPELRKQIDQVSKRDDSAGYDILSFEEDGSPRYVEVKSTVGSLTTPFYISAHELDTAEANEDGYVILRVFDLKGAPKCCEIRFPLEGSVDLSPITFIATFS